MAGTGNVQTYLDQAITHIQAGEYSDARADLISAKIALIGVPDTDLARWRDRVDEAMALVESMLKESSTHRPRSILLDRFGG